MNKQDKFEKIKNKFQDLEIKVSDQEDFLTINFQKENIFALCEFLKKTLGYDYLQFLTCIDRSDKLEVQYHLYSYTDKGKIILKTNVERINGKIRSVSSIWKTADWHEREAYDLFGVVFEGHPELRHILLDEDFEGHPLLKDFTHKDVVQLPKI